MKRLLPPWAARYRRAFLRDDLIAGLVVALMLIPQGLAYATLVGVPPHYGLYASLLPALLYALFASSSVLSIGPMAITSLLAASALAPLAIADPLQYTAAAALLALMCGLMLLAAALLRLGAIAQLISHPVIEGFVSGAALLILVSQLPPLLGLPASGESGLASLPPLVLGLPQANPIAAGLGLAALAILVISRLIAVPALVYLGLSPGAALTAQRLLPIILLGAGTLVVIGAEWQRALAVVGTLPEGLPALRVPAWNSAWVRDLWPAALVISLLGFVENIAIAQAYVQRTRERLDADAELRALGAANIGSALMGAFPVSGSFSRTVVNAEAGAQSPLSGVFAAGLVLLALLFLTDLFAALPMSLLAALIIAAVLQLIQLKGLRQAWLYDRGEAGAMLVTALSVVVFGVETGIAVGVGASLVSWIWRSSRPHIAVIGRVPGTEHFRNVSRFEVETKRGLLMLRIDDNLFFGNAERVYELIQQRLHAYPDTRDLVLAMSAISRIDVTALVMLLNLNDELKQRGVRLHLAEAKGRVLDQLAQSSLLEELTGQSYLSCERAFEALGDGAHSPQRPGQPVSH